MEGEGRASDASNERVAPGPGGALDVPAVLVALDSDDPSVQREAVETIRDTLEDEPECCLPTVPKLRDALERPSIDFHDLVADCLAELAAESPNDVAPSAGTVAEFAREREPGPETTAALRCLAHVAVERPDSIVDHAGAVVEAVERADGIERWGITLLARLSSERPEAVEPAMPTLSAALCDDRESVRRDACRALGRAGTPAVRDRLEDVAATDPSPAVRNWARWATERL